jgi:XTP/dITP diphosphohydrolase
MITILLATRNAHKAQEMRALLGGHRFFTLNDFPGAPIVAEDEDTFAGNAKKKAASLAAWLSRRQAPALQKIFAEPATLFVLADDSGLEVDHLRGEPGVRSARYAAMDVGAANSPDSANNSKLLRVLEGVPPEKRAARFRCVLAGARLPYSSLTRRLSPFSEGQVFLCEGICEGRIALGLSGGGGFGYDPLFIPQGHNKSFGALGQDVKNTFSHRARAIEKLKRHLKE